LNHIQTTTHSAIENHGASPTPALFQRRFA
jgi:hypothetical protein